jgi:hypothetical protein
VTKRDEPERDHRHQPERRQPDRMELMDRFDQPNAYYVRVRNLNKEPLEDRCDGVLYVFEPDVPINIPAVAAELIFGWTPGTNCPSWDHVSKRWGFNTKEEAKTGDGRRIFDNLLVEGVNAVVVELPEGMTAHEAQEAVRISSHRPPKAPDA